MGAKRNYGVDLTAPLSSMDVAVLLFLQAALTIAMGATPVERMLLFIFELLFFLFAVVGFWVACMIVLYMGSSSSDVSASGVKNEIATMTSAALFLTQLAALFNLLANALAAIAAACWTILTTKPHYLLGAALCVYATAWYDDSPLALGTIVQGLWQGLFVPLWDFVIWPLNLIVQLLSLLVPVWNTFVGVAIPPFSLITGELLRLELGPFTTVFAATLRALGKFLSTFMLTVINWVIDGVGVRMIDFVPAFEAFSLVLIDGKALVGTSCEALSFALYMVPVPFGRTGVNNYFDGVANFVQNPIDAVRGNLLTGVAGSQWVTPASVTAMANLTGILPASLYVVSKAINDRSAPNLSPVFDNAVNSIVYSGKAADQAIQGAIDILRYIFTSAQNNLHFVPSTINDRLDTWPPLWEAAALWATRWARLVEWAANIALSVDKWGQIETWNTRKLFVEIEMLINVTGAIVHAGVKDSFSPVMAGKAIDCNTLVVPIAIQACQATPNDFRTGGLGDIVRTIGMASLNSAQFLYDVVLQSVFGFVAIGEAGSSTARTYSWGRLVQSLNKDYVARVYTSWKIVAIQLGSAFGYEEGGSAGFALSDKADPFGCVLQEGLELVNLFANNSLTIVYDVAMITNAQDAQGLLARIDSLLVPLAGQAYRVAACVPLFSELIYASMEPNACSARFVHHISTVGPDTDISGMPREMTLYPLKARQGMCTNSTSPCMRFAAYDDVLQFEKLCGPVSSIVFSMTLSNEPTVPTPPPTGIGWNTGPRCIVLASRLQAVFDLTCYRQAFSPDRVLCNAGYLLENAARTLIDLIYSALHLGFKALEDVLHPANFLTMAWPDTEWNLLMCDAQRLVANTVATALSLLTDELNLVVGMFVASTTDVSKQHSWARTDDVDLIAAEVETLFANLLYAICNAPVYLLEMIGTVFKALLQVWTGDVAAWPDANQFKASPSTSSSASSTANAVTTCATFVNANPGSLQTWISAVQAGGVFLPLSVYPAYDYCHTLTMDRLLTIQSAGPNAAANQAGGASIPAPSTKSLDNLGSSIGDIESSLGNFVLNVLTAIIDSGFKYVTGILETLVALMEAASAQPLTVDMCPPTDAASYNPMRGFLCALIEIVEILAELRKILIAILVLFFQLLRFFLGLIGAVLSDTSMFNHMMLDALEKLGKDIVNLLASLAKLVVYMLEHIPGVQDIYTTYQKSVCPFINKIIDFVNTLSESVHYVCVIGTLGLDSHCPSKNALEVQTLTCAIFGTSYTHTPEIIPQTCFTDATCNQAATCEMSNGDVGLCGQCAAGAGQCNTQTFSCVCGPLPLGRTLCPAPASVAACVPTATCAIVQQFTGQSIGTVTCGECAGPGVYLGCSTIHGDTNEGPACVCSLSNSSFIDSDVNFAASCGTAPVGTVCDPYITSSALALATDTGLPNLLALGNTRLGPNDVTLVPSATGCDVSIPGVGRCANTQGLYFPQTCVCQASTGLGPNFRRRRALLSTESEANDTAVLPFRSFEAMRTQSCSDASDCEAKYAVCTYLPGRHRLLCSMCPLAMRRCGASVCVCDMTAYRNHPALPWDTLLYPDFESANAWERLSKGAWKGHSECADFARSVQFLPSYNATIANMSGLEIAVFRKCMSRRALVANVAHLFRLPLPLDMMHNPMIAIEFTAEFAWSAYSTFRSASSSDNSLLHAMIQEQVDLGKAPTLTLRLHLYWTLFFRRWSNSNYDWKGFLVNATLPMGAKATQLAISLYQTGQRIWNSGRAHKHLWQDMLHLQGNLTSQGQGQRFQFRAQSLTQAVQSSTLHAQRVYNHVVQTTTNRGRRLLDLGSWISAEVTDCGLFEAIKIVALKIGRVFTTYYTVNLEKQTLAFETFNAKNPNVTLTASSMQIASWSDWFCVSSIRDAVNQLRDGRLTADKAATVIVDFLKCDYESITLCKVNRGLFQSVKLVIVFLVFLVLFAYLAIARTMMWSFLAVLLVVPLSLHAAYGYAPTCIPMVPGCLFTDIMEIVVYFKPTQATLPVVNMGVTWKANGLSVAKCSSPPYGFYSLAANGAFIARANDETSAWGNYWWTRGWIPLYDASDVNSDAYNACNYVTLPRNIGHGLLALAFGPLTYALCSWFVSMVLTSSLLMQTGFTTLTQMRLSGRGMWRHTDVVATEAQERQETVEVLTKGEPSALRHRGYAI